MVTINKIAKFLTGSSKIPATGLNKNVTVKFKHDCFPSKSGNICKCLPTVSTCVIMSYIKMSDHYPPPPPPPQKKTPMPNRADFGTCLGSPLPGRQALVRTYYLFV